MRHAGGDANITSISIMPQEGPEWGASSRSNALLAAEIELEIGSRVAPRLEYGCPTVGRRLLIFGGNDSGGRPTGLRRVIRAMHAGHLPKRIIAGLRNAPAVAGRPPPGPVGTDRYPGVKQVCLAGRGSGIASQRHPVLSRLDRRAGGAADDDLGLGAFAAIWSAAALLAAAVSAAALSATVLSAAALSAAAFIAAAFLAAARWKLVARPRLHPHFWPWRHWRAPASPAAHLRPADRP